MNLLKHVTLRNFATLRYFLRNKHTMDCVHYDVIIWGSYVHFVFANILLCRHYPILKRLSFLTVT